MQIVEDAADRTICSCGGFCLFSKFQIRPLLSLKKNPTFNHVFLSLNFRKEPNI